MKCGRTGRHALTIVLASFCGITASERVYATGGDGGGQGPLPQSGFALVIGVDDAQSGLNGGDSARHVLDAITSPSLHDNTPPFPQYPESHTMEVTLDDNAVSGNKQALINSVHSMETMISNNTQGYGGGAFIFYINAHGDFYRTGNGSLSTIQAVDPENPTGPRIPASGESYIVLSKDNPSENMDVSDFTALFNTSIWNNTEKLFLIDSCYSGGFWNRGEIASLASLPRTAVIAASSAANAAQAHNSFVFLDGRIEGQGDLGQAFIKAIDNTHQLWPYPYLVNNILASGQQFVGTPGNNEDLESGWQTTVTSDFQPFAASTPDFAYNTPEPSTFALAALGGLALLAWRRRR